MRARYRSLVSVYPNDSFSGRWEWNCWIRLWKGRNCRSSGRKCSQVDGIPLCGIESSCPERNIYRDAMRHLITIDRYDDRTISYPLDIKSRATRLQIKPRPANRCDFGCTRGCLFSVDRGCFQAGSPLADCCERYSVASG